MDKHYAFFQNSECEYFPCHKGADPDRFNCLFCWCPLYALGEACGGNYRYTDAGVKDCSGCLLPHGKESYDYLVSRFPDLQKLAEKRE